MENTPVQPPDIQQNKVITAVSYLSILCLVPLLLKRDSAFAQFHAKQGLVLVLAAVINQVLLIVPVLGWIAHLVGAVAILVLSFIGVVKALSGEYWDMPYLGEYAKKLKI